MSIDVHSRTSTTLITITVLITYIPLPTLSNPASQKAEVSDCYRLQFFLATVLIVQPAHIWNVFFFI